MATCKCGCGEPVIGKRVFVNKEHQLEWLNAGGARELNALLPDEVRVRGGKTAGAKSAASGKLREAGERGAQRAREIAEAFRKKRSGFEDA